MLTKIDMPFLGTLSINHERWNMYAKKDDAMAYFNGVRDAAVDHHQWLW